MKKLFATFLIFLSTMTFAGLQDDLTGAVHDTMPQVKNSDTRGIDYVAIAREIQNWIFVAIGIIAVAYILYIGAKLLWAPGSTEEITATLKSLAFVMLGLALIPFAYFLIKFIISIRL